MPLPGNHTLNTSYAWPYSPSVGATPVVAYAGVPYRSRLVQVGCVLGGALTTADATVTVAVNGTTVGTLTLTQSGSAAGSFFSMTPASPVNLNQDDVISLTSAGASGASIPGHYRLSFRRA